MEPSDPTKECGFSYARDKLVALADYEGAAKLRDACSALAEQRAEVERLTSLLLQIDRYVYTHPLIPFKQRDTIAKIVTQPPRITQALTPQGQAMTMPHIMNCAHSTSEWCLGCVKEMHRQLVDAKAERDKYKPYYDAIRKAHNGYTAKGQGDNPVKEPATPEDALRELNKEAEEILDFHIAETRAIEEERDELALKLKEAEAKLKEAMPGLLAACQAWVDYFDQLDRDTDPGDRVAVLRRQFHQKRMEATKAALAQARELEPKN